jgi:hypothetical protein
MPTMKQFRAGLRFNALRYFVLVFCLLAAWGFVLFAMRQDPSSPIATLAFILAGGLLAAAGKTAIDILNWADVARQTTHVERVHAVQRVFDRAREVRHLAVIDWRRIHTVIVDNLAGQKQEIRLFETHDETDREAEALLKKASAEELWIRPDGVEAVKRFQATIAAIDYKALVNESDFVDLFNAHMNNLRRELAVAAVGISLD